MKRLLWLLVLAAGGGYAVLTLHHSSGIFFFFAIDVRDRSHWQYRPDGLIDGAQPLVFHGDRARCWLLLHGYGAAPQSLQALGEQLSAQTGQHIEGLLFAGHGRQPGALLGLDIEDWFTQALAHSEALLTSCQSFNLVGSSFGGAVALGLAQHYQEDERLQSIYLINPYFHASKRYGINGEWLLRRLGPWLWYEKLNATDLRYSGDSLPRLRYLNLPWQPIIDSLAWIHHITEPARLQAIRARVFLSHAEHDSTASFAAVAAGFAHFQSDKELLPLPGAAHVLLLSAQRHQLILALLAFERRGATPP